MAMPFKNAYLASIFTGSNVGNAWLNAFNLLDDLAGNSWGQADLSAASNVAGTYSSTTQTLTVTATGALTIDSVVVAIGDRLLLQNQTTGAEKGIYVCTAAGAGGTHPLLKRAVDAAATGDFQEGKAVSVRKGTLEIGKTYICTFAAGAVLDTGTFNFTATTATVSFASVQSALAAATGAVDFNAQALTGTPSISGASGVAIKIGATTIADFGTTAATALTMAANKSIVGAAGTGALTLGSMTGATTLPTGNLGWTGASTKTASLVSTGAGSSITITAGAASTWSTSSGGLTITSAAAATWSTAAGALTVSGFSGINLQVNGTTVADVGATSATAFTLAANKSLVGAAGTGAVTLGSMTGDMTLPTGAVSWTGATGKALTLTSTAAGVTITSATSGTVAIDSSASLTLGGSTATSITAGSASVAVLFAGGLTVAAGKSIIGNAGAGAVTLGSMTGDMTLPTGAVSWAGASGKGLTLTSTAAGITITSASSGTVAIDSAAAVTVAASTATSVTTAKAGIRNSQLGMINKTVGGVLTIAANTIAVTANIHHVATGTDTLKTITVPATITAGAVVHLVPDGTWTYDNTGNITVPSGGGSAVVNKTMAIVWDGSKWNPSY